MVYYRLRPRRPVLFKQWTRLVSAPTVVQDTSTRRIRYDAGAQHWRYSLRMTGLRNDMPLAETVSSRRASLWTHVRCKYDVFRNTGSTLYITCRNTAGSQKRFKQPSDLQCYTQAYSLVLVPFEFNVSRTRACVLILYRLQTSYWLKVADFHLPHPHMARRPVRDD